MHDILVTDTLFIDADNERSLASSGFRVMRLEKLKASEDELISNLQGKVGYILGGIERVTDRVVSSAHDLKVVAFTGSGYKEFIPGWQTALSRGIRLSAAPGANAQSVAEFALSLALPALRNVFALSATGGVTFFMGREFASQTALVVGFGKIGQIVAKLLRSLGFEVLVASHTSLSTSPYPVVSLDDGIARADLVTIHVSHPRGDNLITKAHLSRMKDGAVVVNTAFPIAIDVIAAFDEARAGRLRFGFDLAPDGVPSDLPHGSVVAMNAQSGFLTREAVKRTSDRVTATLINLLTGRSDPDEIRL